VGPAVPRAPSSIVLDDAPAALGALRDGLRTGARAIDLGSLERFDSAAVAVLVALRRETGSGLSLRNAPPNLRTLAALYGVDALLFGPGD